MVEFKTRNLASVALCQQNASARAEAGVQRTGRGIDSVEAVAAVEENAFGAVLAPICDTAVFESTRPRTLGPSFVGFGIECP